MIGTDGAALMARTKPADEGDSPRAKRPRAKGRPKVAEPRRNVVSLRGSEQWREWLNSFAEHARMPAATLVDQAITHYAKVLEFDPPPKR